MRKVFFMLSAVFALASTAAAQQQTPGLITMTGHSVVQGAPDRAWVTVGVEARHPQTREAQEQVAVAMQHIQQRLKGLGIPENALRTSSFNVSQDWEFIQNRRNLRGYVVSNQIEVKVDDIAKVSAVIDGSIAAGANIIHGVRWDMKNRQALARQALQQAYEDARARAQAIATVSGSRLGAVHAVQESRVGMPTPMPVRYQASLARADVAESLTVINPGEMNISATVTVSFLIQS